MTPKHSNNPCQYDIHHLSGAIYRDLMIIGLSWIKLLKNGKFVRLLLWV